MERIYSRPGPTSCNTQLRWSVIALCSLLGLCSAGCLSSVPQYVRGEVAARSLAPIPRGATYRILRSHTGSSAERVQAQQLDVLLRGFGLQPASTAEAGAAELWVSVSHIVSDEAAARSSIWGAGGAIFEVPSARRRRFAVQVSRPGRGGVASSVLWRGELLSDGANRDSAALADPFLRIVLSKFGREQTPRSFSFRVDEAVAGQRTRRAATARRPAPPALPLLPALPARVAEPQPATPRELKLPNEPDAPDTQVHEAAGASNTTLQAEVETERGEVAPGVPERPKALAQPAEIEEPVAPEPEPRSSAPPTSAPKLKPPAAAAGARVGREPSTLFDALFGSAPEPARRRAPEAPPDPKAAPATTAALPAARPTAPPEAPAETPAAKPGRPAPAPIPVPIEAPVELEYAEVGPTWRDASDRCIALTARSDVSCSIYVEVGSSAPHLEFEYSSSAEAQKRWRKHAQSVGGVFCVTAARHGLYGRAIISVRAEGAVADRKCKELPR